MQNEHPAIIRISDPLSELTRKERRNLVLASAITLVIKLAGLVPQRINALGLDFGEINTAGFELSLALLIIYFLAAFLIYGWADYLQWKFRFMFSAKQAFAEMAAELNKDDEDTNRETKRLLMSWEDTHIKSNKWVYGAARRTILLRGVFEFFVPPAIAITALAFLYKT